MEKQKINNMALVDNIMEVITQTDEWQEIQLNDPRVVASTNALREKMAHSARSFRSESIPAWKQLCGELLPAL